MNKTRVLVPNESLDEDNGSRTGKYTVFQKQGKETIIEVDEDEAEEIARRLNGLVEISE